MPGDNCPQLSRPIGPGRILPLILGMVFLCSHGGHSSMARADTARGSDAPAPRSLGGLDGQYLLLGPVASVVRSSGSWDSGFGGALSLVRVRERMPVAAVGIGVGGFRLARGDRGLLWADFQVGSRRPAGLLMGLTAGVSAEVGEVISTRWGGHAGIWMFVGVVPYARIGVIRKSGTYVDFGIRLALPTYRF